MVPEKPIPEVDRSAVASDNDPVVSRSFAPHYVVSMVLLMATLFWALWDEDFGQRPWKTFQHEWKGLPRTLAEVDRKSTRLNSSHGYISYAVFCLKKKKKTNKKIRRMIVSSDVRTSR